VFVLRPFAGFAAILGEMAAAQTWERIAAAFPVPTENPEVGSWLREVYYAPAAAIPWETKIERATGSRLQLAPLARHWDVRIVDTALSEEREEEDAGVAEYFKGIDLSDLR
jgi:hypothetical protein